MFYRVAYLKLLRDGLGMCYFVEFDFQGELFSTFTGNADGGSTRDWEGNARKSCCKWDMATFIGVTSASLSPKYYEDSEK